MINAFFPEKSIRSGFLLRVNSLFILIFSFSGISGQTPGPQGKFLEDSITPGKIVRFTLSYSHPSSEIVVFPDSLPPGTPFIIEKNVWYPTISKDGVSKDSALFLLRSFEIKDTLTLSLPVVIFSAVDSMVRFSSPDTIFFHSLLKDFNPESATMAASTDFVPLRQETNYPLIAVVTIAGGILTVLTGIFFGKPIRRYYKGFKLMRMHKAFLQDFQLTLLQFEKTGSQIYLEEGLSAWKKYLSKLDENGLESFTTTEISGYYRNEDLTKALRDIDRAVYGGIINEETGKSLASLKRFSSKRFINRKNEIGNV